LSYKLSVDNSSKAVSKLGKYVEVPLEVFALILPPDIACDDTNVHILDDALYNSWSNWSYPSKISILESNEDEALYKSNKSHLSDGESKNYTYTNIYDYIENSKRNIIEIVDMYKWKTKHNAK
jgi:hypothetical protein